MVGRGKARHAHDKEGGVVGFTGFVGDTEGTKSHYFYGSYYIIS